MITSLRNSKVGNKGIVVIMTDRRKPFYLCLIQLTVWVKIKGLTENNRNLTAELFPVTTQNVLTTPPTPAEAHFKKDHFYCPPQKAQALSATQKEDKEEKEEVELGHLAIRYSITNKVDKH